MLFTLYGFIIEYFFGNLKNNAIFTFTDVNKKELYIFISLIIILFLMGIYPKFFVSTFHTNVLNLIVMCKNFNI